MGKSLNPSRIRLYSGSSSYTPNSTHYVGQTGLTSPQSFCTRKCTSRHNSGMHSGAAQMTVPRR